MNKNFVNNNENELMGVSVIICCYNSAKRLPETLKHLAQQKGLNEIQWEVIIVDNNCSDDTVTVANNLWLQYGKPALLHIVSEKKPGLSFARLKGIEQSKYEYLLFCDDDNWLNENYLQLGHAYFLANKNVAVLGGESIGNYETEAPEWFLQTAHSFAIGKQADKTSDVTNTRKWVWGAGSFYSKKAINSIHSSGLIPILSDRTKDKMTSGGDLELCLLLRLLNYQIHYLADLQLIHFMPKERFNEEKYFSLIECNYQNVLVFKTYEAKKMDWMFNVKYFIKATAFSIYFSCKKIFVNDFEVNRNIAAFKGGITGFSMLFNNRAIITENLRISSIADKKQP